MNRSLKGKRALQRVMEEVEQRVKQSNLKQVPLPTSSAAASNFENFCTSASAIDPKRRKGFIGSIDKAFNMGAREIVDSEIAKMFYTRGCLFTLLEILITLVHLKVQVNFQVMSY